MSTEYISLTIREIRNETEDAVSILLDIPPDLTDKLHYKPGQYLTVLWMDGTQELRRSYSISSVPDDPYIAITIKEVAGGKISPLLCRKLKPGDRLNILPPEGRFTAEIGQDQKRNLYLVGAGSGITPLMSIARFALEKEPKSTVILLYGSRTEAQIIFRTELDKMVQRYQQQLYVYHTLSKPDGGGLAIMKSLFGKKKPEWQGLKGRISATHLQEMLQKHPMTNRNDLFFLCGPGDFIEMAEEVLKKNGISEDSIKKEYFTPAHGDHHVGPKGKASKGKRQHAHVKAHLRGQEIEVEVSDKTILDTMLEKGYDAPYSCHSGACATCMAKVISGEVEMDACFALSDKEIANGYVLACQSRPVTDHVELSFDE